MSVHRAMSELSKKEFAHRSKAQFKVKFLGAVYSKKNLPKKPMSGNRIHGPLVPCFSLPVESKSIS
jgi:hypothetical protein